MLVLERCHKLLRALRVQRQQTREDALLLVGVMIGCGVVEVLEDRTGGGAGVVVAAVRKNVVRKARERGQLALDAAVAREEHPERIVEAGRRVGGRKSGIHTNIVYWRRGLRKVSSQRGPAEDGMPETGPD